MGFCFQIIMTYGLLQPMGLDTVLQCPSYAFEDIPIFSLFIYRQWSMHSFCSSPITVVYKWKSKLYTGHLCKRTHYWRLPKRLVTEWYCQMRKIYIQIPHPPLFVNQKGKKKAYNWELFLISLKTVSEKDEAFNFQM